MKRALATALALLFSYMLMLPAFAAAGEANLPACCRRAGKHHCANTSHRSDTGKAFASVSAKCPYTTRLGTPAPGTLYAPAGRERIAAAQLKLSRAELFPSDQHVTPVSFDARFDRGPPSFSL